MSTRVIPAAEWPEYLATFGGAHRAWLATIERAGPGLPPALEAVDRPLASVGTEVGARGVTAIEIRVHDISSPRVVQVRAPVAVSVDENEAGAVRALEIVGENGERVSVRFRVTQLPEMLDGIAPGEVSDVG
jgi:hypothetical protein